MRWTKEEAKSELQKLKAQDLLRNMEERRKLLKMAKRETGAWKSLKFFELAVMLIWVFSWQFFKLSKAEFFIGIAIFQVVSILLELGETHRGTDALIELIGEENLLKKPSDS